MVTPISPEIIATSVVLENVFIDYGVTSVDGEWVGPTPATVKLQARGLLADDGLGVRSFPIEIAFADLPQAGKDAIIALYQYIESQMAAQIEAQRGELP